MPSKITPVRPIRSIAILLCDNDFGSTFRPLLEECKKILDWTPDLSKEVMEKIIREGIRFFILPIRINIETATK